MLHLLDLGGQIVLDSVTSEIEIGAFHLDQGSDLEVDPGSGSMLLLLESGTAELDSFSRTATSLPAGEVHLATPGMSARLRVTSPAGADLYLLHFTPVAPEDEAPSCITYGGGGPQRPRTGKLCSA